MSLNESNPLEGAKEREIIQIVLEIFIFFKDLIFVWKNVEMISGVSYLITLEYTEFR